MQIADKSVWKTTKKEKKKKKFEYLSMFLGIIGASS